MIKEIMTSNRKEVKEDYNKILKKESIKKEFLLSIKDRFLNLNKRSSTISLFKSINAIAFAGFDYYYAEDVIKSIEESKSDDNPKIDILINEEQIDKLRTTIDCFPSLEFIDYDDKHYIWYKSTSAYCNLIPFERKDEKTIVKENGVTIELNDSNKELQTYDSLQYKIIK